jgi:hypothetical protein
MLRNAYLEPFYLIVSYPDENRNPIEYKLEPATDLQDIQYYNVWLDSVSSSASGSGAPQGTDEWTVVPDRLKKGNLDMRMDNQIRSVIAEIKVEKTGQLEDTIRCEVRRADSADSVLESGAYYKNQWYSLSQLENVKTEYCNVYAHATGAQDVDAEYASCMGWFDLSRTEKEQHFSRRNAQWYTCISPYDSFNTYNGGQIDKIKQIRFTVKEWNNPDNKKPDNFNQFTAYFRGIDGYTIDTLPKSVSGSPISTQRKRVRINVYEDTNDDGHGDTPIWVSGMGDQSVELFYDVGTTGLTTPVIDWVEPPGLYFNNDGHDIPFGFNMHNIKDLKIEIRSRDSASECTIEAKDFAVNTQPYHDDTLTSKYLKATGDCSVREGRTTYPSSSRPPFVEYYVEPMGWDREPTTMYDVTVTAVGPDGKATAEARKTFAFDKTKAITKDKLLACQGGGECTSTFVQPVTVTWTLGEFNTSAMPVVRTG